jgi:hypothetical protein
MNVKKAIKRVAALGVGVSMLGATLLGATANPYDLSEFPVPLVEDGLFNGLMVVGDDAAPADIIGVTDIAMSLQYSSTVKETIQVSSESGVSLAGDSVKIQRAGDVLELNEYLGSVMETMESADAEALKSFTVSNDKGSTDVNQYLRFAWGPGTIPTDASYARVRYTKDDDDNVGDFLWFKDSEEAYQYEIEFIEGFESDIDSSDNSLEDLEDETLHILGEDFAVVQATWTATGTNGKVNLKLMGGAIHDTIEEGETKTYTLKGKEYEVTALIISDWAGASGNAKVKVKVNGEVTKEMSEGSTEILNDGTTLGVREVMPNEAGETAGGDILEFYLGANKIELEDTYAADTYDGTVQVNEENIEDSDLLIQYTNTSSTVKINKIIYRMFTDGVSGDEPFLAPGQGLREKLDEPEGMISSSWDFRYEGLSDPGTSLISFKSSGDDEYRITFTNTQGIEYSNVRLLYSNASSTWTYGDDDDFLVFQQSLTGADANNVTENCTIRKNDYFIVGHNSHLDTGVTRVLRFDSVDTDNKLLQLTDTGTGASVDAQYTALNRTTTGDVINVGGYSFDFILWNGFGTDKNQYRLCVDLDDDNAVTGNHLVGIVTNGGGMLNLSANNYTSVYRPNLGVLAAGKMMLVTDDNNFDEDPGPDEMINITFNVSTSAATMDVDVASGANEGLNFKSPEDNDDINLAMSNYGVLVKEVNEDNDPDSVEIQYPLSQKLPQVFVTFEKTVTVEGGAGTITVERPQRIEIGSAVLASQVSDPTAANLISVGGPCINSVTAEVMGLTYPACGADSGLAEGEGIVKLYESGGKVAIVVAGWEAEDTTRATRVLADYKTYQEAGQLVGSEVKVTGTSATEFTVTPVSGEAVTE